MKHYCIKCGKALKVNQLICPKCNHCSYLDFLENSGEGITSVLTARQLEANTQWTKYRCGKNGCNGHGFSAEDANALHEILWGDYVQQCGRDNSKHGPDRICNGIKIQTKYYANAKGSVYAAFDPQTGMYIYKGQILEVPSDQYEEAVKLMRGLIKSGKVEGITDPEEATTIVKKGSVTYRQAKNIAKAGNIDSLVFDAKTQSVAVLSAFGISFAINLGMMMIFHCKTKEDKENAIKMAFLAGIKNGTITMTSGILTSQVLRTTFGRNMAAGIQWTVKKGVNNIYKSKIGKKIIHKLAESLFKKTITGAAAKNVAIRFLRTNVITNMASFTITSIPDVYYVIRRKISVPQFIQNLVVNASTLAGGTIGAFTGTALGGAIGLGIGMIGGASLGWVAKKMANYIRKDDSEKMFELIKVAMIELSHDYMIQTEEEFQECIDLITKEKVLNDNLIKEMYHASCKSSNDFESVEMAYQKMEYYFGVVIRRRKTFHLSQNQKLMLQCINDLGDEIPNIQEDVA